jgi:hypothetical protein
MEPGSAAWPAADRARCTGDRGRTQSLISDGTQALRVDAH